MVAACVAVALLVAATGVAAVLSVHPVTFASARTARPPGPATAPEPAGGGGAQVAPRSARDENPPAAEPGSRTASPPPDPLAPGTGEPPLPPALRVRFTPAARWDGGMVGYFTIANTTASPVDGWRVVVTVPAELTITASWEAGMSRRGNRVTFTPTSTSSHIGVGETARFGMQASTRHQFAGPLTCEINDAPCA
jgi:hypothetical protein